MGPQKRLYHSPHRKSADDPIRFFSEVVPRGGVMRWVYVCVWIGLLGKILTIDT